jgi:hypothetical protein
VIPGVVAGVQEICSQTGCDFQSFTNAFNFTKSLNAFCTLLLHSYLTVEAAPYVQLRPLKSQTGKI